MSEFHRELLLEIVRNWNSSQLSDYIKDLEQRMVDTKDTIRTLRKELKKKDRKLFENTGRGGK